MRAIRSPLVAGAVFVVCAGWLATARAQEEEADLVLAEEYAEAMAGVYATEFAMEEEAMEVTSLAPMLSNFTAPDDEAVAESSQIIGPTVNPTADPILGDGEFVVRK